MDNVHGFKQGKNKELVYSRDQILTAIDYIIRNTFLPHLQAQHVATAGTLVAANWTSTTGGYTQTINVTGVTATASVIVSADPDYIDEYTQSGIYATGQGAGTLTFFAKYVPSNNLIVNAVVLEVQ